ncbi:pre-mRNA 3'-end-processing factor FIP1-like isoform X1 [Erpetoichthys calabaricus]|uniref:Pre-mRNA 3'-end-processing factor FIP1-like n=1 Tax=Erpetoichthys calabaricus TaxID=27687 RepID=A0A8C4XCH9_ERPCA|nr:pre-mRNA 3'-end-processing factor FIP1-like isoform X1 [Erpetoichthys calabaricus]
MATDLETPTTCAVSNQGLEPDEDEEHWLYGDENPSKQDETSLLGFGSSSQPLQDASQEIQISSLEDRENTEPVAQSGEDDEGEEDSESDSDDDDVKVTIGNIKTGAPSYMGTPMNLNLKTGRGYGPSVTNKLQPKGIDLEASGNISGLPVLEVDLDSFEDKPWRKPGADLSDYFNYGFNEDTWKAYCEKQRRLQLGLEPNLPNNTENKITVQQGRTGNTEKEPEPVTKQEFIQEFASPTGGRVKAGPPPNRKLGGTIDVIGGQTGAIRRVEGRRREKHGSEENPIQVLGDHGNKTQQFTPSSGPPPPPPPIAAPPPPHFLQPPPPITSVPPPLHPPGMPPPTIPGLFPPPMAPPPSLLIPTLDGSQTSAYSNRPPPPYGYTSGDSSFVSYPPISSSHTSWVTSDNSSSNSNNNHWEYQGSRRDRERDRDRDRDRDRERDRDRDRTPAGNEYNNEDERYRYYSRERSYEYEREYHHVRDRSRDREERHRERRHRDKDESKHKSSRRKQHEGEEGESHRRHKHKKNKRSKEEKEANEENTGDGEELDSKEH